MLRAQVHPASFFALKLECHNQRCFAQLCRLKASSVLFFPFLQSGSLKATSIKMFVAIMLKMMLTKRM